MADVELDDFGQRADDPRRVVVEAVAGVAFECHAGHGLDYNTARIISALPEVVELNIGHFLIGEAIFVGLAESVRAMRKAMDEGRGAL